MKEISVHHEWGTLSEAVVGTAVSLRIPNWSDECEFLTPEVQQLVKENQGKPLKEADPGLYEQSISQMDALVALLESRGVVVRRAKPLTPDEEEYLRAYKAGMAQCFTRDPILVIGNNLTIYHPQFTTLQSGIVEFDGDETRFHVSGGYDPLRGGDEHTC